MEINIIENNLVITEQNIYSKDQNNISIHIDISDSRFFCEPYFKLLNSSSYIKSEYIL